MKKAPKYEMELHQCKRNNNKMNLEMAEQHE